MRPFPLQQVQHKHLGAYRTRLSRGFTLIISVLISSILLSIGLAIFSISIKEATLSSVTKNSQTSFYAADAGIECIEYWEYPPRLVTPFSAPVSTGDFQCNGVDVVVTGAGSECGAIPNVCNHNLVLYFEGPSDECAEMYVRKDSTDPLNPITIIESRGYNTCDEDDPRRTERAIRITQ
jgi:hypothetical protein